MTTEFLYAFGYHSPVDIRVNAKGGDDESFGFFRILAETEEQALIWGHELSRWYADSLFDPTDSPHWAPSYFASWIELEPDELLREAAFQLRPVKVGEYPDLVEVMNVLRG